VRNSDDARAAWNRDRLFEIVSNLPVEIPLRLENRFHLAVRENQPDFIVLAAKMHMRLQVDKLCISLRRHFGNNFRVFLARRNCEIRTGRTIADVVAEFRRMLGEDQAYFRSISCRLSGRCVVHAENDVGTFRHKLRRFKHAEILGTQPRIEFSEKVALRGLASNFRIARFIGDARDSILHPR